MAKKVLCFVMVLVATCCSVFCDENLKFLKEGWYLSLDGRYDTFSGDFDFIEPGASANLGLGYTSSSKLGFECRLLFDSIHNFKNGNTFWLSNDTEIKYFDKLKFGGIDFNFKYYLFKSGKIFPYLKAGAGIYSFCEGQDYSISGLGYQGGIGAEQYIIKNILFHYGVIYRQIRFDKATFEGRTGSLNNALNEKSMSFEIGISRYWD